MGNRLFNFILLHSLWVLLPALMLSFFIGGHTQQSIAGQRFQFSTKPSNTGILVANAYAQNTPNAGSGSTDASMPLRQSENPLNEVIQGQDPAAIDSLAQQAASCLELPRHLQQPWTTMVRTVLLTQPLVDLETQYVCLYNAFSAGYPVGVSAALLGLPKHYIDIRLKTPEQELNGSLFNCSAVSRAVNLAIDSGFTQIMTMTFDQRYTQQESINDYIAKYKAEARQRAGRNLYSRVQDAKGGEWMHPDMVHWYAWAVAQQYQIRKPKRAMQGADFKQCIGNVSQ